MMSHALSTITCLAVLALTAAADALDCGATVPGENITLELLRGDFSSPVDIAAPPGDTDRLFVVERAGRIRIVDLNSGQIIGTFLDIASRIRSGGEQGLLGLAFHPRHAENGEFFVNYTRNAGSECIARPPPGCTSNRNSETVIARFRTSTEDPNLADAASEEILLTFCQPYGNHNAGQIVFGPRDGLLYISTGDGGSGGDPCNSGQRPESLLGKMLRVDVDRRDEGLAYAIPADNPFVDDAAVRAEIWAFGLRNPWRFDFDPSNGDLYIADVGQNDREEIDWIAAESAGGQNFEWRRREGDRENSATALGPGTPAGPIYDYPHGAGLFRGCSVTGGVVYRGCRMPDLEGRYFFADHCNDWIGSFRVANGETSELRDETAAFNANIAGVVNEISTFGRDGRGEVYVADLGGQVYRIVSDSCRATRTLPSSFTEGSEEPVLVSIDVRSTAGPTTLRETFPAGWSVSDAGGGTVTDGQIEFSLEGDGVVRYELVPVGECRSVEFSGTVEGATCDPQIQGNSTLECRPPSFVLLDEGSEISFFRGRTIPPASWSTLEFDDTSWERGTLGIGYGDGDDATELTDMRGAYVSVFCRVRFDLSASGLEPGGVASLDLALRIDDGAALYLNGEEVARVNLSPGTITPNTEASVVVGDAALVCEVFESVDAPGDGCAILSLPVGLLRSGVNVLAASVHNATIDSSDLSFIPTLVASGVTGPISPRFRRGDVDDSGALEITDAVRTLLWLFAGGTEPPCLDAADVDNSGSIELTDAIGILAFLFQGAGAPPDPGPSRCGPDDDGALGCVAYAGC